MNNCIKIKKPSLFYSEYAFVDAKEYLSKSLFNREKIQVWCDSEYERDDTDYKVIFCKVRKKDENRFLNAISQLDNKMKLWGHNDYDAFCGELFAGLA